MNNAADLDPYTNRPWATATQHNLNWGGRTAFECNGHTIVRRLADCYLVVNNSTGAQHNAGGEDEARYLALHLGG